MGVLTFIRFPFKLSVLIPENAVTFESKLMKNYNYRKIKAKLENSTEKSYNEIIDACRELFKKKSIDYGTAWRILRLPSLTDQIYIKAKRIRSVQEKGKQKVADDIKEEFVGIINYCMISIIQMKLGEDQALDMPADKVVPLYDEAADEIKNLLANKNHDYGEAWRDMRVSSITDIILMKILRIKQIEDNQGQTLVSEGIKSNYQDIINYAVFSLIKLNSGEK